MVIGLAFGMRWRLQFLPTMIYVRIPGWCFWKDAGKPWRAQRMRVINV